MVILERNPLISLEELSQPILKLAGTRFNPQNNTITDYTFYTSISIKNLDYNHEIQINGLPKNYKISEVSFSPDQNFLAFCLENNHKLELWVLSLNNYKTNKLTDLSLIKTLGKVYQWSPDSKSILAQFVNDKRAIIPQAQSNIAPIISETAMASSASRTYQDLLKNKQDESLFDYYFTSQLKMVYVHNGEAVNFALPAIYSDFDISPDGKLVMTKTIEKPYSYQLPYSRFPSSVDLYDKYGAFVANLNKTPLQDNLPNGFDAVTTSKRAFQWRHDKPQTYIWVEAKDGGNPSKLIPVRDVIYMKEANGKKTSKLADCYLRFHSIVWGDDQIAIVTEKWWRTRTERRVFIKPGNSIYRVNLWDRYYENTYNDPGEFIKTKNEYNRDILLLDGNRFRRIADPSNVNVFSISKGASDKGEKPFLLKFNVKTKITDTLFRSKAPYYELPVHYNLNSGRLLFSRESVMQPANYYAMGLKSKKEYQLTYFENPYLPLLGVTKRQVNYKRIDGLKLSSTIYLPKDYHVSQGKLPVLMWAYPKEYKTAAAASQVKGSPYLSPKINWSSPIYWATQGFLVMEVDMPIVGESNDIPNDTFIEQLKDNAIAAIDEVEKLEIGDRKKIIIGGHSYGAFMVANLLTHNNGMFIAGIARSGAYNRTLTPFGFQNEERTYWQDPDLYFKMSPFSYADRQKTPILIIHGEADENTGTFPMQSERYYAALKGNGATARLVILPFESHHYKAKESVLHMLWEMDTWIKKYTDK